MARVDRSFRDAQCLREFLHHVIYGPDWTPWLRVMLPLTFTVLVVALTFDAYAWLLLMSLWLFLLGRNTLAAVRRKS